MKKEQMLLKVITVKGFESEDTLCFAETVQTVDNIKILEKAEKITTMSFGETLAKLALAIAKENIEEDVKE